MFHCVFTLMSLLPVSIIIGICASALGSEAFAALASSGAVHQSNLNTSLENLYAAPFAPLATARG